MSQRERSQPWSLLERKKFWQLGIQRNYRSAFGSLVTSPVETLKGLVNALEDTRPILASQNKELKEPIEPIKNVEELPLLHNRLINDVSSWGFFVPLYALRSQSDWGCGSFTELRMLQDWAAQLGARWISILPILAQNFDCVPSDPSPYAALTRFAFNEIYLDVEEILKSYPSKEAKSWIRSKAVQDRIEGLRASPYVHYEAVYDLKKTAIQMILKDLDPDWFRSSELISFLENSPFLNEYCLWRSRGQEDEYRYHLFVQYLLHQNLLARASHQCALYMDFPVGVRDDGFDRQYFNHVFLNGFSVGAPPEPIFEMGQNWGFSALNPCYLAQGGLKYFRQALEKHCRYSKILRIDHVMGLYRVYLIPHGFSGRQGAYLRFPKGVLFRTAIEVANQFGTDLIGEDLGTVPEEVSHILSHTHIKSMAILQISLNMDPQQFADQITSRHLVALNNHDMPTWESFKKGDDLKKLYELGLLSEASKNQYWNDRKKQLQKWSHEMGGTCYLNFLSFLMKSKARYKVVTLEDLWGEVDPQNIPGTYREYPNWRRRLRYHFEDWTNFPQVTEVSQFLRQWS
ncbi:MAG: 4-alpha-glucanotransferase [Bdellovibrionaceae bacterium]|nr:4-alpha-glucanotransferase [Pseudobdellovibrionaceae bacterium]MDW8190217.1 4-alpha-glucanotransferase [Pseudobdellovibrionaceae bacterium]